MSTKATKNKKAKKVVKTKKAVEPEKIPDVYFRVDMEIPFTNKATGEVTYHYQEYFPGRSGTTDEAMARSIADSLIRIGQGGRLVELDGTPDGKVIETWGGIGRVLQVAQEENKLSV